MDVQEVLRLADDLIFKNTGKHLDDLQQAILFGTLQHQKYAEIAKNYNCTESHVKKNAAELWKFLSEALGEEINKTNFKSTIERQQFFIGLSIVENNFSLAKFNFCTRDISHSKIVLQPDTPAPKKTSNKERKTNKDLTNTPTLTSFYGRTEELAILQNWILQQNCQLIAIVGITGTGKTSLATQLINQIQDNFDNIIWRSLRYTPPLAELQKTLIQFLSQNKETDIPSTADSQHSLLLQYLQNQRNLIILDDIQTILNSGQLSGNYIPEYEDYSTLFKLAGEFSHNSCILLLSWEPPREITALSDENTPVRLFQLKGLETPSAIQILREKNLTCEDQITTLINSYEGNPLFLKTTAQLIKQLFAGKISEFFQYDSLLLAEDLTAILHRHIQRLSPTEKQIISQLATHSQPVAIPTILTETQLSPTDLCSALQSLDRRSLLEKQQTTQTLFHIGPVIKEYLKNHPIKPS